ncbi:hypothetical protein [Microbacterium sp.]|uniref:hypothetical protein n=1 Tax=Microbacterium sp. TaxID=51671 RepID=UPI0039E21B9A
MAREALCEDALGATRDGFTLRLSLPWIRSLPLASLIDLAVVIDGEPAAVHALLGARAVPVDALGAEPGWWFVQDRVVLAGDRTLADGIHDVSVAFRLVIPYMPSGTDGPLVLPFRTDARLAPGTAASSVSRDVDGGPA